MLFYFDLKFRRLKKQHKEEIQRYFEFGLKALKRKNSDVARQYFKMAMKINPEITAKYLTNLQVNIVRGLFFNRENLKRKKTYETISK